MREWKPGDVAMVTLRPGEPERRMVRYDTGSERGWYGGIGPAFTEGASHSADTGRAKDAKARPLVVIDPEDREQARHLANAFFTKYGAATGGNRTNAMQAALRSLVTPPKPDEPGTWGVVEASCVHSDHRRWWMHHADGNWYVVGEDTRNNPDDWDSLIDPVIVRDGVVTA